MLGITVEHICKLCRQGKIKRIGYGKLLLDSVIKYQNRKVSFHPEFYTLTEVKNLTGLKVEYIRDKLRAGIFTRTIEDLYHKNKVDAYVKDKEERLALRNK